MTAEPVQAVRENLLRKLETGTRGEIGLATQVAMETVDNPAMVSALVDCLEADDQIVVSHAAHAVMQAAATAPGLFDGEAERLISILDNHKAWEIGEQVPKVLARSSLTPEQAERVVRILVEQIDGRSAIASASALSALKTLGERGLFSKAAASALIAKAAKSPRKAVSARARKLIDP